MRLLKSGWAALPIALVAASTFATAAFADEAYVGRWAASVAECSENPIIMLTADNANGATFGCDSATYVKDGDDWAVNAKQCSGEDETEAPYDLKFRLRLASDKLQVFWDDGSKSAALVKCEEEEVSE